MLINTAKKCTVNQFIDAKYENNLAVLGEGTPAEQEAALQSIFIEFCDLTGNDNMPELPILTNIAKTQERIMKIEALLFIQRDSIARYQKPDEYGFPYFERLNHTLSYSGDNEAFLKELTRIENKEKRYKLRLSEDEKSLENIRIAHTGYTPIEQSRIQFLDNIITLSDEKGRDIDRDKTTMEMLGIMIAKHNKSAKAAKNN